MKNYENLTLLVNGQYLNFSYGEEEVPDDLELVWDTYLDGELVTPEKIVNTLHVMIELDHIVFHGLELKSYQNMAHKFVKVLEFVLQNITVKRDIKIVFKGIPLDVMQEMNKNVHPFLPFFQHVISFRNDVLKRTSSWKLNVTIDFAYTSVFRTSYGLVTRSDEFNWDPLMFKHRVKPAGAMFAKARRERLDIIDGFLKVLDRPEFIYIISKTRSLNDRTQRDEGRKNYDWRRAGKQVGITFTESTFHNSFIDPTVRKTDNFGAQPTGFDCPLPFYNQICLEIVSETGAHCRRADVSEKITRPMLYGMPFLTNPWYDNLLRHMGGESYWDLLNIKIPKIKYVDHNLDQIKICMENIHFTFDESGMQYTDFYMSDLHPRLHIANSIMAVQAFRKKCADPGFVKQVRNVADHNKQLMMDHLEKHSESVWALYNPHSPCIDLQALPPGVKGQTRGLANHPTRNNKSE